MAATLAHQADVAVLQRYARAAGVAMLLWMVFGTIGELYLPGRIVVAGDAAATAANLIGNPMLLRLTFASYLVEGFCDIVVCVFWYILLRPADRNLALLSAFVGIVPMALAGIPLTLWLLFRGVRAEAIPTSPGPGSPGNASP